MFYEDILMPALCLCIVCALSPMNVCVRSVLAAADADTSLQQYSCCLLYQCLLTDSPCYTQRLVHADDSNLPLICIVLGYLVSHDCEWGSVIY